MSALIPPSQRYSEYLKLLKEDFVAVAKLQWLYPDGTVAFESKSDFLQDGTLSVNFQNGSRRMANVFLENTYNQHAIDPNKIWFGQQVRLLMGLVLPDNTEFFLPQGVFYINDPQHVFRPSQNTIELPLVDKWAYLDGTLFGNLEGNYIANINDNIFAHIANILLLDRGNGIKIDNFNPVLSSHFLNKTVTLPDGTVIPVTKAPYTLRIEPDGKTYADALLSFADMLIAIIGYDNTGRLRVEPSSEDISDATKPVMWEYKLTEKEFLGGTYAYKMSDVYNVVRVVGAILNGAQAKGEAINDNIASPTSIYSSLGKRVRPLETNSNCYADSQCQELAEYRLKRLTILQNSVSFESSPMYHFQENSLVLMNRPDRNSAEKTRHLINGFSIPIAQTGIMTINATSVHDV